MNTIKRQILNVYYIFRKIKRSLRKKTYRIDNLFEKYQLFCVKEASYVETVCTRVFKLRKQSSIYLYHDSVLSYLIPDCIIIPENDFVLMGESALYKKHTHPMFGSVPPQDRNIIRIKSDIIDVYFPKKNLDVEYAIDLCGTNANAWSHFLVQFFPKLSCLEKFKQIVPKDKKISILLEENCDKQIVKIVEDYLSKYDFAEIRYVPFNCAIHCSYLLHVDNTAFISDFDAITTNSDTVIPEFVASFLKKSICDKYDVNENEKYSKLFITRHSSFRNITNYCEVEKFFENKGYYLLDPGKVSLEEKVEAFKNASLIVGPSSSGLSNLIFCNRAKVLRMSNSQRINDGYFPFILENWDVDGICLIGKDSDAKDSHCSYTIDMDELRKVCSEEGF